MAPSTQQPPSNGNDGPIAPALLSEMDCRNFNLTAYRQQAAAELLAQYTTWMCCAFAPENADLLAAGNSRGEVRVYNVSALAAKSGSAVLHSWQAHRGPVYQLSFATLGGATVLLTCGDDGCVRGWALDWATFQDGTISSQATATQQLELTVPNAAGTGGILAEVNALYSTGQGQQVYAGAGDGVCYGWDVGTGQLVSQLRGHKSGILTASGNAAQLATGSTDGTVRLWDLRTAECHAAISPPIAKASVQPPVKCVQFDAGGNWLVVGAGAGLHLWNVHASAMTSTIKTEAPPQAIVTQPNRILTAGDEQYIRKYDFSGTCLTKMTATAACGYGLASSDTTRVVAVCGAAGMLDIFTENGSRLGGLL